MTGARGYTGATGQSGFSGSTGATGWTGTPGLKGGSGATGATGRLYTQTAALLNSLLAITTEIMAIIHGSVCLIFLPSRLHYAR